MTINQNTVQGKWNEIKGDLQKAWGKLTDDELEKTKGDVKAITGLLQQRYGQSQEGYDKKLADIFKRFDQKKDEMIEQVKTVIKS